ncbi:hypothetical protein AADC60_07975 [Cytobacillus pseudoceanisediminis]|uniref:Uncharacterized protein n=1 Tax=Cytobacillus pseudoceanisediminis TaxID=3051614 RepID=A0ABZ2ZM40_9BACI
MTSRVLNKVGKNRIFNESMSFDQDFIFADSPKMITFDECLENRIPGNKDNENILIEVKYTSSIEVKQKKEGTHLESSNDDLTYEKLKSLSNEFNEDLTHQLSKLKTYVLNSVLDIPEKGLDKNKLKDKAFTLYSNKVFTMNDVLKYVDITTAEFIDEINARGIPFQYEPNFNVLDEDIEDWI